MQHVYQIAESLGVENITLCNLYIGGCSLAKHAKNAKENNAAYRYDINTAGSWTKTDGYRMSDVLKSQEWDLMSLVSYRCETSLHHFYSNQSKESGV